MILDHQLVISDRSYIQLSANLDDRHAPFPKKRKRKPKTSRRRFPLAVCLQWDSSVRLPPKDSTDLSPQSWDGWFFNHTYPSLFPINLET